MPKPTVRKHGNTWRVYIGARLWSADATHDKAVTRAHGIASYARVIRVQNAINRITHALDRIEANR